MLELRGESITLSQNILNTLIKNLLRWNKMNLVRNNRTIHC